MKNGQNIIYGAERFGAPACRYRDNDYTSRLQLSHRAQHRNQLSPAEINLAAACVGVCGR